MRESGSLAQTGLSHRTGPGWGLELGLALWGCGQRENTWLSSRPIAHRGRDAQPVPLTAQARRSLNWWKPGRVYTGHGLCPMEGCTPPSRM